MMAQSLTEEDKGESDHDDKERENRSSNERKAGKIRDEGDSDEAAVLETDRGK